MSYRQLVREVNKALGPAAASSGFRTLFRSDRTDWTKGEIGFAPIKVKVSEMSAEDKPTLKAELEKVLAVL